MRWSGGLQWVAAGGTLLAVLACTKPPAEERPAEWPTERPGIAFAPDSLAPGARVGALVADRVEVARAYDSTLVGSAAFRGELTLSGRTMRHFEPDARSLCFEADTSSARSLPRWRGDARRPWFCFENDSLARALLGPPEAERPAVIVIDRFTIHRGLSDQVNSARLVRVAEGSGD